MARGDEWSDLFGDDDEGDYDDNPESDFWDCYDYPDDWHDMIADYGYDVYDIDVSIGYGGD